MSSLQAVQSNDILPEWHCHLMLPCLILLVITLFIKQKTIQWHILLIFLEIILSLFYTRFTVLFIARHNKNKRNIMIIISLAYLFLDKSYLLWSWYPSFWLISIPRLVSFLFSIFVERLSAYKIPLFCKIQLWKSKKRPLKAFVRKE